MTALKTVRHLTTDELAARLGVCAKTVKNWRRDGLGPVPITIGGIVRYRETEVEAWERSRLTPPAA